MSQSPPLPPPIPAPVLSTNRPSGLTALAILNFVFGGLGVVLLLANAALIAIVSRNSSGYAHGGGFTSFWAYASPVIELAITALLFISGVGYLKMSRVAGYLGGQAYAILAVLNGVVNILYSLLRGGGGPYSSCWTIFLLCLAYPVATLILLNTTFRSIFLAGASGNDQAGCLPVPERPAQPTASRGLLTLAVINFLYAGLGFLFSFWILINIRSFSFGEYYNPDTILPIPNLFPSLEYSLTTSVMGLGANALAILAGVGFLRLSRNLGLVVAHLWAAAVLLQIILGISISAWGYQLLVGVIYPTIALLVIDTTYKGELVN